MSAISAGYAQGFLISKIINTSVDGVDIEGRMDGSSFDVKITITKPFKNMTQSWYTQYAGRGHRTYDGRYGVWLAQVTLKDMYWLGEYLQRKSAMLKRKFSELEKRKATISEGKINESEFKMKRYTMRNQLKSGDISNRVYQHRIGLMKKEYEALDMRIWNLEDQFFEAYFVKDLSAGIRYAALEVLKGRKSIV